MNAVDFHGLTLQEAINTVEKIVDGIRLSKSCEHYELITGNGVIKHKLIEVLGTCGISCREKLGNSGTLIAEME